MKQKLVEVQTKLVGAKTRIAALEQERDAALRKLQRLRERLQSDIELIGCLKPQESCGSGLQTGIGTLKKRKISKAILRFPLKGQNR